MQVTSVSLLRRLAFLFLYGAALSSALQSTASLQLRHLLSLFRLPLMSERLEQPSTSKQGQSVASVRQGAAAGIVDDSDGLTDDSATACSICDVYNDEEEFRIRLDVSQFTPDDIAVTVRGDSLLVYAVHYDGRGKDRVISSEYIRSYGLPKSVAKVTIEALYDSYVGVLLVSGSKDRRDKDSEVHLTEYPQLTYSELKRKLCNLPVDRQIPLKIFPNKGQEVNPQLLERLVPIIPIDEEAISALKESTDTWDNSTPTTSKRE